MVEKLISKEVVNLFGLYDNSLLMGAPPHRAILPGVRPIWVGTYGCGVPGTSQPVTGNLSSASPGTSQPGTGLPGTRQHRKVISSQPGIVLPVNQSLGNQSPVYQSPVNQSPVNQALGN